MVRRPRGFWVRRTERKTITSSRAHSLGRPSSGSVTVLVLLELGGRPLGARRRVRLLRHRLGRARNSWAPGPPPASTVRHLVEPAPSAATRSGSKAAPRSTSSSTHPTRNLTYSPAHLSPVCVRLEQTYDLTF